MSAIAAKAAEHAKADRKVSFTVRRLLLPAVLLALFLAPMPGEALVSGSPCDGNVCTDQMVVGGQTVDISWTQHIRPDGTLKVRLNGGVYNEATLISHIVYGLPPFAGWDKYANPSGAPLPVFLPDEDINPAQTAYERRDTDGCIGCVVDQVMTVTFSGLADGAYTFDISIFQNGEGGTKNNLGFFVDGGAPSNADESEAWSVIPDMDLPCADTVDNDLSFSADCLDAVCSGEVGRVADGAVCEFAETTCSDGFDNDGDGLTDCLDSGCDGLPGQVAPPAVCQYGNESGLGGCSDGFDNDGDGLTDCLDNISSPAGNPALTCWQQDGFGCPSSEAGSCGDGMDNDEDSSFDSAWDDNPLTGADCLDYDCFGDANCPSQEHRDATGADADLQCFNSLDDDLDGLFNCADPDCIGMDNGTLVCYEKEFDILERYQKCANAFDDDGDADTDCADGDCGRQFGNCGPCPDREDVTYDSCSDGSDDDNDGAADCSDADCTAGGPGPDASLGQLDDAARCAVTENSDDMCRDRFDNDGDADTDCADSDCAGFAQCAASENTAPLCGDVYENDGDGLMDCVDADCWGLGSCSAKSWAAAACQIVPRLGPFKAFASVDPTVTAAATEAAHVNSTDTIRIIGAGSYSSVTIVIGDNTDPADYYPYAQPKTAGTPCTLSGTNSGMMDFIAVTNHVVQIFDIGAGTINGFDLTFTCPTTAVPTPLRDYPISISVTKLPGDIAEYGDEIFDYVLYEATPPVVNDIEAEGEIAGVVDIARGDRRRFRAIAEDPGVGLDTSGICSCTVTVDGVDYPTPDSDCVTGPIQYFDDEVVPVTAFAEDGVNNIGAASPVQNFTINVTPAVSDPLIAYPADGAVGSAPFFNDAKSVLALDETIFLTAASGSFNPTCEVIIRDRFGAVLGGPVSTTSFLGMAVGNSLNCENLSIDLAALGAWGAANGEYFVTIRATDEDGDSVESNRRVIYVCRTTPAAPGDEANVCSWADFDRDGAAEALYTNLYWSSYQACDNCVNLPNPLQSDENANGVGEQCEPGACGPPANHTGRCELDREFVCGYDSDDLVCPGDAWCCPDPGGGLTQECKCPWGLCLYGGQVCFDDPECKFCDDDPTIGCITDSDCELAGLGVGATCGGGGGFGTCAGDGATSCKRDADCTAASVSGPCLGANICDNLMFPWLETTYGNVYSGKKIYATEEPPLAKFNATYCITAKSTILNFTSELCNQEPDADVDYVRPKPDNSYATILGRIDVAGLLAGRYGDVVTVASGDLDAALTARENPLNGEVIAVTDGGDAVVNAHTIFNANGSSKGKGTVLIVGGNLYLNGNIGYGPGTVTRLDQLASLGWIVLPAADGSKGHVYIDQTVTSLVGAFFVGGEDGMYTVTPPTPVSETQLTVYGLAIARKFHFNRTLRNVDIGSELFIYDGRAVANPPPGFEDIGKSLPVITDTP